MKDIYKDTIYLLTCAVNDISPDKARVQSIDLQGLYQFAKYHSVRAIIYTALSKAGLDNEEFSQAYHKAVRKNILFDVERTSIFSEFERNGIWYMPLKGALLKELYPKTGMREMSDNDVLYDAEKQKAVKQIMQKLGYTAESVGTTHHDVYKKPPVLNFEMHTELFGLVHEKSLYNYYADVKRLLCKDEDNSFGYHLADDDFYVYMTAHEWKHYFSSGSGIRSLLDCYVYYKAKGDKLNWNYITEQCKKLKISDFEQKRRALAIKIFADADIPELTEDEYELLMYYLTAGTYGSFDRKVANKLKNQSKISFWIHSVFISRNQMKISVPFTRLSPLLYPVGVIWRCFRILFIRPDKLTRTIKAVKKYGK